MHSGSLRRHRFLREDALEAELGDRFIGRSFPSASSKDHSVLTESLQQSALDEVIEFLRRQLGVANRNGCVGREVHHERPVNIFRTAANALKYDRSFRSAMTAGMESDRGRKR